MLLCIFVRYSSTVPQSLAIPVLDGMQVSSVGAFSQRRTKKNRISFLNKAEHRSKQPNRPIQTLSENLKFELITEKQLQVLILFYFCHNFCINRIENNRRSSEKICANSVNLIVYEKVNKNYCISRYNLCLWCCLSRSVFPFSTHEICW